jgi:hypothetical protein
LQEKIADFFSIDKTKLAVFLVLSLIALGFFASPAHFFGLALPAGGLYYFFLFYVSASLPALGLDYYPSLGDWAFSTVLATTVLGYFYLLSSYIAYVARRKHDLTGMLMIASVALVFISPFLILSFPPVISSTPPASYAIADGESCVNFPATGRKMEWDEETKTCYMRGSYSGSEVIGIAENVAFEVLPGGNFNTLAVNNNGTLVVNGGFMKNTGGYVYNRGTIDIQAGVFVNDGTIESGVHFDYGASAMQPSTVVNRADLENNGYIYNYGNFINQGSLDNSGQVQFFDQGVVTNAGRISSNGRIDIAGEFGNEGEVLNSGTLIIYQYLDGSTTNRPAVVNNFGEIINTVGELENTAQINNYGSIANDIGKLENYGTINNRGTISNTDGELLNNGTIKNYCDAATEGQVQNVQPVDFCK